MKLFTTSPSLDLLILKCIISVTIEVLVVYDPNYLRLGVEDRIRYVPRYIIEMTW
jgi:hypothetical protein